MNKPSILSAPEAWVVVPVEPVAHLQRVKVIDNGGAEYEYFRPASKELPGAIAAYARPDPNALADVVAWVGELEDALAKINDIRNSIIGCQKVNWSEHVYPLVAALNEAGIEGQHYPEALENMGTLIERTVAAEDRAEAAEARVKELEARLEKAGKVIEPFAEAVRKADAMAAEDGYAPSSDTFTPMWTFSFRDLRAAAAFKEGK